MRLSVGVLACVLATVVVPAGAQERVGVVSGRVLEYATGRPVPNAIVEILDDKAMWVRATATDSVGRYRIEGVALGPRTMRARRIGHAPEVAGIAVSSGGTMLDFTLGALPLVLEQTRRTTHQAGGEVARDSVKGRRKP
jgi:hypothetical protein